MGLRVRRGDGGVLSSTPPPLPNPAQQGQCCTIGRERKDSEVLQLRARRSTSTPSTHQHFALPLQPPTPPNPQFVVIYTFSSTQALKKKTFFHKKKKILPKKKKKKKKKKK